MKAETKLKEIGLELPPAGKPMANYVRGVNSLILTNDVLL